MSMHRFNSVLALLFYFSLLLLALISSCGKGNAALTSKLAGGNVNVQGLSSDDFRFITSEATPRKSPVRISAQVDASSVTVEVSASLDDGSLLGEIEYPADRLTPSAWKLSDELNGKVIALAITNVRDRVPIGVAVPHLESLSNDPDKPIMTIVFSRTPFAGGGKAPSAVSTDGANRVSDLTWDANDTSGYDIGWSEKNVGDYDLNGEVGIPDITLIAQRYLNSTTDNSEDMLDKTVDGDGDGEIGIPDITPIAQNYLATLEGYRIYRRSLAENTWTQVADIPRSLTNGDGIIPSYEFTDTTAPTDRYVTYEVRPYALGVEGVPSTPAAQIDPEDIDEFVSQAMNRDITTMSVDEAAQLFIAYILAFGGPEIGVLDENGAQLNSDVVGEASYSLRPEGARNLAERMLSGETVKLGHIAMSWTQDYIWTETPTVDDIIAWMQASVNDAWANLDDPNSMAIVLMFATGDSIPTTAPVLTFDTELDPFQYFFANLSFLRWAETDGKATSRINDWIKFYPNYRGTTPDTGYFQRLYNQWASIPFTTKVIGAVVGAGVSAGIGYYLGGAVSITAVAGSASFALLVAPPLLIGGIIVNEVLRDVSIPKIVEASVSAQPITEGGKLHSVHIYFQTGSNQQPNPYAYRYRLWRSTGSDSGYQMVMTSDAGYSWGTDIGPNVYGIWDSTAEAGEAYMYKVDRVDIGAFWNTTSERSDGIVVKIPSGPVILGLVHREDGTPIQGIRVSTSDGANTFATFTNASGQFKLFDVPQGPRVITFRGRGFGTVMEQLLVQNQVHTLDIALPNYVGDITQPPAFMDVRIEQTPEEETSGMAHIVGQATNLDGPQLILVLNGEESLFQVSDTNGNFNQIAVLNLGENKLRVRAVNLEGETMTEEFTVVFTGEFAFRATLTWSRGQSDIDLHTYSPTGEHSYWSNKVIADGSLDVDNVVGYGPENFTCTNPQNGAYRIEVHYYADHDDDDESTQAVPSNVRLLLNPQTPAEQTLNFASTLVADDEVWSVCTINVVDGVATAG